MSSIEGESVTMETHNYHIEAGEKRKIFVAENECVSVELPHALVTSEPITIYNKTVANKVLVYYMSGEIKTDLAELNVDSSLILYPNVLDSVWETIDRTDVPYSKIIGAALNCNESAQYIPLQNPLPLTMFVIVRVFREQRYSDVCHVIRTPYITNCLMDCIGGPFNPDDHAIISFHIEEGNTLVIYPHFIGEVSNISICLYA